MGKYDEARQVAVDAAKAALNAIVASEKAKKHARDVASTTSATQSLFFQRHSDANLKKRKDTQAQYEAKAAAVKANHDVTAAAAAKAAAEAKAAADKNAETKAAADKYI